MTAVEFERGFRGQHPELFTDHTVSMIRINGQILWTTDTFYLDVENACCRMVCPCS